MKTPINPIMLNHRMRPARCEPGQPVSRRRIRCSVFVAIHRILCFAFCLAALLVLAESASARQPQIFIDSPRHGGNFDASNLAPGNLLQITGHITGPVINATVKVNDTPAPIAPNGEFVVSIQMNEFSNTVLRPVLAELTYPAKPRQFRDRVVLYDMRPYPTSSFLEASLPVEQGMSFRFTPEGVGALGAPYPVMSPIVGLDPMNTRLSDAIGGGLALAPEPTDEICYPLDVAAGFLAGNIGVDQLIAFLVSITATDILDNYVVEFGLDALSTLVSELSDVGEYCIEEFRPSLVSAEVGILEATLESDDGHIDAQLLLPQLVAEVDIELSSFVRVSPNLPLIEIPSFDIQITDDFNVLTATLEGEIEADVELEVQPDPNDAMQIDVVKTTTISPRINVSSYDGPGLDLALDIATFLTGVNQADVEAEVLAQIEAAMNVETGGDTDAEGVLDEALSNFEITFPEHTVVAFETAPFTRTEVFASDPAALIDPGGLHMAVSTTAKAVGPVAQEQPSSFFVPGMPPEDDPVTPHLNPYHYAVSVSTGSINQTLRAAAATSLLHFERDDFSWNELGLSTQAPGDPSEIAPLTGTTLELLVPELRAVGQAQLFVRYRPSLAPFVTMERDPVDSAKMFFHLGQYLMEFVEPANGNQPERVWMQVAVDGFSDTFALTRGDVDGEFLAYTGISMPSLTLLSDRLKRSPSDAALTDHLTPFVAPALSALVEASEQLRSPEFTNIPRNLIVPSEVEGFNAMDYRTMYYLLR